MISENTYIYYLIECLIKNHFNDFCKLVFDVRDKEKHIITLNNNIDDITYSKKIEGKGFDIATYLSHTYKFNMGCCIHIFKINGKDKSFKNNKNSLLQLNELQPIPYEKDFYLYITKYKN